MLDISFITFNQMHDKENTGSTRLRAEQLVKYWQGAEIYQTGKKYDVEIFQKAYWKDHMKSSTAIKILDQCDPDFLERPDKQWFTDIVHMVDGVTFPTEEFKRFFNKMYPGVPTKVIKDRLDLEQYKEKKVHKGDATKVVWFGYHQNVSVLQQAVGTLRQMNLKITVISDDMNIYLTNLDDKRLFQFIKYDPKTINNDIISNGDICLLPKHLLPDGKVPFKARFKSENKTVTAWALGLPVANNAEELKFFIPEERRKKEAEEKWTTVKAHYDIRSSVIEYIDFIKTLK